MPLPIAMHTDQHRNQSIKSWLTDWQLAHCLNHIIYYYVINFCGFTSWFWAINISRLIICRLFTRLYNHCYCGCHEEVKFIPFCAGPARQKTRSSLTWWWACRPARSRRARRAAPSASPNTTRSCASRRSSAPPLNTPARASAIPSKLQHPLHSWSERTMSVRVTSVRTRT